MSGPASEADTGETVAEADDGPVDVQVFPSREARVGAGTVRRALPLRRHRTVGAWCFLDHFGPEEVTPETAMQVGPHPHIGLQTVTWLLEGEAVHTDSVGSEQPIRPGQLNLMTAGRGVAHAEDGRDRAATTLHGVQLWVAQPEATRWGDPAFEHHAELPGVEWPGAHGRMVVGELDGVRSPARTDTPLVGADLEVTGRFEVPTRASFEHAIVVLRGAAVVEGRAVAADELGYVAPGHDSVRIDAPEGARLLLLGGEPFPEPILMWWNFVARTQDEITEAHRSWEARTDRFGEVATTLAPMSTPRPPWLG